MKNVGMSLSIVLSLELSYLLSLELQAGAYNGNDSWEEFGSPSISCIAG